MMKGTAVSEQSQSNQDFFTRFTTRVSAVLGHAWVFAAAVAVLILWAFSGPLLHFSDTWQLIINTCTTIVTFLMVFVIQNTQNRDNMALNLKIEALMAQLEIHNKRLYGAETSSEKEIEEDKAAIQQQAVGQEDLTTS
jgi:low affinity Fe/Cu permease